MQDQIDIFKQKIIFKRTVGAFLCLSTEVCFVLFQPVTYFLPLYSFDTILFLQGKGTAKSF